MRALSIRLFFAAFGSLLVSFGASAEENSRVANMPYSECLEIIAEISQEIGEEPIDLASTSDVRTVRINAEDGFVTVSCSRADNKMILSKSPVPAAAGITASR